MSKTKTGGELEISLKAGDSEPQWKIGKSFPFYEEILEGLQKLTPSPLPEGKDDTYKGFAVQFCDKKDSSDGQHFVKAGTNRGLEIMLINSAPDSSVSDSLKQLVKSHR